MLSHSFTKAELQLNHLKHKQLPPKNDFALLQNGTLIPVLYLIKHEEILPQQKHDSYPLLDDYGTDQFSIRINDKGNDIIVKPSQSFSFKAITPFQTKFKTPIKKTIKPFINNLSYSMILILQVMTKIIYIPEFQNLTLLSYMTQHYKQKTILLSTNQPPKTSQKSVSAINVQTNLPSLTHCPQTLPFYDSSFFKYQNYFQGCFLPNDYSLDITTLQQQQSQDPVLRTVYSWIVKNEKPETLTPLITGTPFLHAYYKRFSKLFIDGSTNLISLYLKHPTTLNQSSTPDFVPATIRICVSFRLFKTVFNKLHEHSHTGI